jgi:hypothetical protein
MGLLVPMYPYYSAKGTNDKRETEDGTYNVDNKAMLDTFLGLFRYPLVREVGIKCGAIYARDRDADVRTIDWVAPTIYEIEIEGRPLLEALLNELDDRGTIVIPNRKHLTDDGIHAESVLKRLWKRSLAPITVDHPDLQKLIQPLEKMLKSQPRRLTPEIERAIKKFFHTLTSDAVHAREKLNSSIPRKQFEKVPTFENKAGS